MESSLGSWWGGGVIPGLKLRCLNMVCLFILEHEDWCIEPDHPEACRGNLANNLEITSGRVVRMKVLKFSKFLRFVAVYLCGGDHVEAEVS